MERRYDYRCNDCQRVVEIRREPDADVAVKCSKCYGNTTQLITNTAIAWNCPGGTRTFGSSSHAPAAYVKNPGHEPLTLGDIGLTNADGAAVGIH